MASFRTITITAAAVLFYCLAVSFGPAILVRGATTIGGDRPSVQAYASPPPGALKSIAEGSEELSFCKSCSGATTR